MRIFPAAFALLALPMSIAAEPAAPAPDAMKQCAQAARQYVEMTQGTPPTNAGQKNVLALVQRESFPRDCAREVPAETRACLVAAKAPQAWTACLKAKPTVEAEPPSAGLCSRPAGKYGPVIVTQAEYADRRGAKLTRFSQLTNEPLEVCGIPASQARLRELSCDDGSEPFAGGLAVGSARVGNVGKGGRCKAMIDHYQVRCPEKTYDVYVDMYWCRPKMWPHY